jgi:hypothetical protein
MFPEANASCAPKCYQPMFGIYQSKHCANTSRAADDSDVTQCSKMNTHYRYNMILLVELHNLREQQPNNQAECLDSRVKSRESITTR